MIKLYLFTFSFYTLMGSYDTFMECAEVASLIHEDYRHDPTIRFSLYCVGVEEEKGEDLNGEEDRTAIHL